MKPPRAYARGILAYSAEAAVSAAKAGHFFGGIRRSTPSFALRATEGLTFAFILGLAPEVFCEGG